MTKTRTELKRLALQVLKRTPLAVLATTDKTGRPNAAAMLITADDDFSVYFLTRADTLKAAQMRRNGRVALAVSLEPPLYLQIHGLAREIKDKKLRSEIISRLARSAAAIDNLWPPVVSLGRNEYRVYRVRASSVRAIDLRHQTVLSAEPPVITII